MGGVFNFPKRCIVFYNTSVVVKSAEAYFEIISTNYNEF